MNRPQGNMGVYTSSRRSVRAAEEQKCRSTVDTGKVCVLFAGGNKHHAN